MFVYGLVEDPKFDLNDRGLHIENIWKEKYVWNRLGNGNPKVTHIKQVTSRFEGEGTYM